MLDIIQWLGEAINPGPSGTIELHRPQRKRRKRIIAIIRLALAILLLVIWVGLLVPDIAKGNTYTKNWILLGTLIYLALGYFVHPKPEYQNLGLFWGLIDNPFRISDNWNRWLVSLEVVLMPGCFVAVSLVESVELIVHSKAKVTQ